MVAPRREPVRTLPIRCTMVSIVALRGTSDATQMLVLQRASAYLRGAWSYVAGHIKAGETAWQAALRELHEETGLAPTELYATSFCEQVYFAGEDCIETVPAFVARIRGDAAVRLNPEHAAFRWLMLDAAADTVPFGSQRDLLAHIQREFIARTPSPFLRIAIPA